MKKLVLGSGSPRRREILETLGMPFVVVTAPVDEDVRDGEASDAYLERVVLAKLAAVRGALALGAGDEAARDAPVILVADTTVVAGGAILGKPASVDEARVMIDVLAGTTHEVRTRFALALSSSGDAPLHAETVTTRVTFRSLTPGESRAYAETREGLDKAGGYAVQGRAMAFAQRIDGSYANVVGLPACEVVVALARLGRL